MVALLKPQGILWNDILRQWCAHRKEVGQWESVPKGEVWSPVHDGGRCAVGSGLEPGWGRGSVSWGVGRTTSAALREQCCLRSRGASWLYLPRIGKGSKKSNFWNLTLYLLWFFSVLLPNSFGRFHWLLCPLTSPISFCIVMVSGLPGGPCFWGASSGGYRVNMQLPW